MSNNEEQAYIDPRKIYGASQAARLVGTSLRTLNRDANRKNIPFRISEKGYRRYKGKDLINYRDYVI